MNECNIDLIVGLLLVSVLDLVSGLPCKPRILLAYTLVSTPI